MENRGLSLEEAIQLGQESKHLEFKGKEVLKDKNSFLKVARAMLAMANNQDGGTIFVGIHSSGSLEGCDRSSVDNWHYDAISEQIAKYADPYLKFDRSCIEYESKVFLRLYVYEFDQVPVICKQDASIILDDPKKQKEILKAGMVYVRSRKKPESIPVPSQTEMRDILELAIEKGVRGTLKTYFSVGVPEMVNKSKKTAEQQYKNQLGDL
jgi:predicted HTH transcriptional regulator